MGFFEKSDLDLTVRPHYDQLPGGWTSQFVRECNTSPVTAAAMATTGVSAGYAALRYLPKTTSLASGAIGFSKLILTDVPDLIQSDSASDLALNSASCAFDLSMVAGAAMRYIPCARKYAWIATATGMIGRSLTGMIDDAGSSQRPSGWKGAEHQKASSRDVQVRLGDGSFETRSYDLYVPEHSKGLRLPLLYVLHGANQGDARGLMEKDTGMNYFADKMGFAVVYPVARVKDSGIADWNSPGAGVTPNDSRWDDIDYFVSVHNDVRKRLEVDDKAIHVVGFSSGGSFAQHLRGKVGGFAGVGSVHGTLMGTEAVPTDRSAFLSILGDCDPMLPPSGGKGIATTLAHQLNGQFARIDLSNPRAQFNVAATANGAAGVPRITSGKGLTVRRYDASQANGYPVIEYEIEGGWRGGMLGSILGRGQQKNGISALHAWHGFGEGGFPIIGVKSNRINISEIVVNELLPVRRSEARSN